MRMFEYRNEFHESEIKQSRYPSKQNLQNLRDHEKVTRNHKMFLYCSYLGFVKAFNQIKREFVYGAASLQLVNVNFTF